MVDRGGGRYQIQGGDNFFALAGSIYGNQRFFAQLMAANPGITNLQPGMFINIPRLDIGDPDAPGGVGGSGLAVSFDAVVEAARRTPNIETRFGSQLEDIRTQIGEAGLGDERTNLLLNALPGGGGTAVQGVDPASGIALAESATSALAEDAERRAASEGAFAPPPLLSQGESNLLDVSLGSSILEGVERRTGDPITGPVSRFLPATQAPGVGVDIDLGVGALESPQIRSGESPGGVVPPGRGFPTPQARADFLEGNERIAQAEIDRLNAAPQDAFFVSDVILSPEVGAQIGSVINGGTWPEFVTDGVQFLQGWSDATMRSMGYVRSGGPTSNWIESPTARAATNAALGIGPDLTVGETVDREMSEFFFPNFFTPREAGVAPTTTRTGSRIGGASRQRGSHNAYSSTNIYWRIGIQ